MIKAPLKTLHRVGSKRILSSIQWRRLNHSFSNERRSEDAEEIISYAKSKHTRTIDKTILRSKLKQKYKTMHMPLLGIPRLKSGSELKKPETMISTLSNGLRIASEETYGQLCTVGILVNVGSRLETEENQGVTHLLEAMAFKSTVGRSHEQIMNELETLGANITTHSSREQILYCVDVLREYLEPAMSLLSDSILHPLFSEEEVMEQKMVIGYQMQEMTPDMRMKEALHLVAYKGSPLGNNHYCQQNRMEKLSGQMAKEYCDQYYTAPNMVLAGAGVDHQTFVELGEKYFSSVSKPGQHHLSKCSASEYTGGLIKMEGVSGHLREKLTRSCMAFEVGGWNDERFVPTCVLQTLLGGGDSFSAGGPGKGMYSRLYREVLNRHYWAESAEAFTSVHLESGLIGISGASSPENAGKLLNVIASHFAKLAQVPVEEVELSRAKNMLKCNVLTQLESRIVLFEDIGRQVLSYGFRETPEEVCQRIDRVSASDIQELIKTAMLKPPSIACIGDDTSQVSDYESIVRWF